MTRRTTTHAVEVNRYYRDLDPRKEGRLVKVLQLQHRNGELQARVKDDLGRLTFIAMRRLGRTGARGFMPSPINQGF